MTESVRQERYRVVMSAPPVSSTPLAITSCAPGPRRRHWARVLQFSRHVERLESLDTWSVDDDSARWLITQVCASFDVPVPLLKFHARRSMYTGACERPRDSWLALLGEEELSFRESNGWGVVAQNGAIRLGRTVTLMTVAHELAHHIVFHRDAPATPAHGRVWVSRFDEAATAIAKIIQ